MPDQNLKPYDPQSPKATEETKNIDKALTAIFTDTGRVSGASSQRNDFFPPSPKSDSHYELADGKMHTIHIYANETASSDAAGVYIPKKFSELSITSKDTVIARNPTTKEVILIAHVQVGDKESGSKTNQNLRKNIKTVRDNETMYIGQIGGKGGTAGSDGRGIHSHLSFFPSEASRLAATAFKSDPANFGEYESKISQHLANFKDFAK
jgi:hypothetical protein